MFNYEDINIHYVDYGDKSKDAIVYLHGWGQNIEMMMPIAKPFIKRHNVLLIDLPGFGKSEEPKDVWEIYDYSDMLNHIIKELKIKNRQKNKEQGRISTSYLEFANSFIETKTIIDNISISVYIDRAIWSVDGSKEKEMSPVLNGFMTSFILEAETMATGTSLRAPKADDVIVTITSVNGKHYFNT